ncbi:MAG: hypothetical protein FJ398_11330 [Verrucomicrobia bacterium]|nr:hypothetical protein [Verrucomicrobiota bacterium]
MKTAREQRPNGFTLIDPRYSLFAPYLQSPSVYQCPSDRAMPGESPPLAKKVRSYSLNWFLGWAELANVPPLSDHLLFRKSSDLSLGPPSGVFAFLDVRRESICWPTFMVDMSPERATRMRMFPASYHDRSAMLGFADGHTESRKWSDSRTLSPASVNFHNHDTASPNNPDITWLQQRATIRK